MIGAHNSIATVAAGRQCFGPDSSVYRSVLAGLRIASPHVAERNPHSFGELRAAANSPSDVYNVLAAEVYCVRVRGRVFASADYEARHIKSRGTNTRASYVRVDRMLERLHVPPFATAEWPSVFGRVLHFYEASYGAEQLLVAHVSVYPQIPPPIVAAVKSPLVDLSGGRDFFLPCSVLSNEPVILAPSMTEEYPNSFYVLCAE
jgi:hypothetical protein